MLDASYEDERYGEARNTWEIGKTLGLYSQNDEEVIKALVVAHENREENVKNVKSRGKKGRNKNN